MRLLLILASAFALLTCACIPVHVYVSSDGCTSRGDCPYGQGSPKNYYWQPLHEAVVQPGAGDSIIQHELCHAWQGRTLPLDDITLKGWLDTPEGRDFPDLPWSWSIPAYGNKRLEDAAWTCAAWVIGARLDPVRHAWAEYWIGGRIAYVRSE